MTFAPAIEFHRTALLRLVAALIAGAGFAPGKPAMLTRMLRGTLLYSLRPIEAATRRLLVIRADLLKTAGFTPTPRAARGKPDQPIPRGDSARVPPFALFDPRKRFGKGRRKFAKHAPCIRFFDDTDPPLEAVPDAPPHNPDEQFDATSLHKRLQSLEAALKDLPQHAKRLLRRQARREKAGKGHVRPMRPGKPPGHRERGKWEVDDILRECHRMALETMAAHDTG